MSWLDGFQQIVFAHSLGFPNRPAGTPVRGVIWHTTQGWRAEHAFNVYNSFPSCPHFTVEYAGTDGGRDLTRHVTQRRFQHVPTDSAAYAVEHGDETHVCRVETNASGVVQIERVGFADDDVTLEELRWLGEAVLAPILAAHPTIPPWVYKGPRMSEQEWGAWAGGQCGHRDVCCQPQSHSDPGGLDLDAILHFALELNDNHVKDDMPDYIIRDARDSNHPWIAVYPDGNLRHIGGDEAGHIINTVKGLVLVDERDTPSYERAVKQAGSTI